MDKDIFYYSLGGLLIFVLSAMLVFEMENKTDRNQISNDRFFTLTQKLDSVETVAVKALAELQTRRMEGEKDVENTVYYAAFFARVCKDGIPVEGLGNIGYRMIEYPVKSRRDMIRLVNEIEVSPLCEAVVLNVIPLINDEMGMEGR